MRRTSSRVKTLFLALVLLPSLCACTQKPRTAPGSDKPEIHAGKEILFTLPDRKQPDRKPVKPDVQPEPAGFSEEAEQSLTWLRERMNVPQILFGAAFLGYTGEISEVAPAMLQKYPFIPEIDATHTISGTEEYLFCLVPLDENATVSVNLVQWLPESDSEEILEVLYRSESGEPVLFFADCNDDTTAYDPYIQVQIVDSAGNSCQWYPQLDALGYIVPCLSESGDSVSFDFSEYGWRGAPAELAPWLDGGYCGVYASGLEGCWTVQAAAWDTKQPAKYYLWFFPEDEDSGSVDLDWQYEGSDLFEEMWSGFWELTSVPDGPSYVTMSLSLVGGENYGVTDGPYYISATYPLVISPSGEEMVLGAGLSGVSLPFMPQYEPQPCTLTLDSWLTDSPDW